MLFDTIAAIATAQGDGGVAIIRISGEKSFEILDKIFKPCLLYTSPSPRDRG